MINVTLYNKPNPNYSATMQFFVNRGFSPEKIQSYINSDISEINSYTDFGIENLQKAAQALLTAIKKSYPTLIIVDPDVDGMTSSALLINYLYRIFPTFVENHLTWYLHKGKVHGLSDCIDNAKKYKLIICPDSSSNDYKEHTQLKEQKSTVIVLDHHEADRISEDAIIINNQLSDYPNKFMSGVGVVYQFCKFLDDLLGVSYANTYIDLVALGNQADMMSGMSKETKTLIFEGFKEENIKNPYIRAMGEKNNFSFSKSDYKPSKENKLAYTPIGMSFFLIPLLNAICRSGTLEEKYLVFESMLSFRAFEKIPSNKRGHKPGEMETILSQALRTSTNVKNRQDREVIKAMEKLEMQIEAKDMLKHKVLLFLLEPGEIAPNIAGLIANKIMAKYQRCCAVLTKISEGYAGSMRAYSASGLNNFKDICENSRGCYFVAGHQSAAGLGISANNIEDFLEDTDNALANLPDEASYHVDYIWDEESVDGQKILEISELNDYIMQDIPRSYIYLHDIKITQDNLTVMKNNTIKISIKEIGIMMFSLSDEEIAELSRGEVALDAICKCTSNTWNFNTTPQLIVEKYEIKHISDNQWVNYLF